MGNYGKLNHRGGRLCGVGASSTELSPSARNRAGPRDPILRRNAPILAALRPLRNEEQ